MDEANALSWQGDVVDIYSNSWGPSDDGFTVAGPGTLLQMTLETSVQEVNHSKPCVQGNDVILHSCRVEMGKGPSTRLQLGMVVLVTRVLLMATPTVSTPYLWGLPPAMALSPHLMSNARGKWRSHLIAILTKTQYMW